MSPFDRSVDSPAFSHSFQSLPGVLYEEALPSPVADPRLVLWNAELAIELGFASEPTDSVVAAFAGNGGFASSSPIATAYAGHQFGNFVPRLGDGRAILLGELESVTGERFEIQLKGAGRTSYSRGGDGRAAIGPVLREHLVSEWMHRIGVPTTRALASVATGDTVYREESELGAVLTRVARSHLRVGHFQYARATGDIDVLRALADYAIHRVYPELLNDEAGAVRYRNLWMAVRERQARLIAHWMSLGFIHGVMNTDNCSISGDTIDYGPCAFMDEFDENTVFSSIDVRGRYAFANQPQMGAWNLARLAETLLPLMGDEAAVSFLEAELRAFPSMVEAFYRSRLLVRLGLADKPDETPFEASLEGRFLRALHSAKVDFHGAFRSLRQRLLGSDDGRLVGIDVAILREWEKRASCQPLAAQQMAAANPLYIPRNHALEKALNLARRGDFEPVRRLHAALQEPWIDCGETDLEQPGSWQCKTFCGT